MTFAVQCINTGFAAIVMGTLGGWAIYRLVSTIRYRFKKKT